MNFLFFGLEETNIKYCAGHDNKDITKAPFWLLNQIDIEADSKEYKKNYSMLNHLKYLSGRKRTMIVHCCTNEI